MKRISLLIALMLVSVSCFAVTTATLPKYIDCPSSTTCQRCNNATCTTKSSLPTKWNISTQNFQAGIYTYAYDAQHGVNAIFDIASAKPNTPAQIMANYTKGASKIVLSSWTKRPLSSDTVNPAKTGYNPNFIQPTVPSLDPSWLCPFPVEQCAYVPTTSSVIK